MPDRPFAPQAPREAFSDEEWAVLVEHGAVLRALARGTRSPKTDAERSFVEVVGSLGLIPPESLWERAWIRYMQVRRVPLTVEMVPSTSWYDNLRSRLSRAEWDRLRRSAYEVAGHRCEICGVRGRRLECHERWKYDDTTHVQTLLGLEALCSACHRCRHLGRASVDGRLAAALRHLAKINDWSETDAEMYAQACFEKHAQRSRHEWTLDLSWLDRASAPP